MWIALLVMWVLDHRPFRDETQRRRRKKARPSQQRT
jgi:hypothetical protein